MAFVWSQALQCQGNKKKLNTSLVLFCDWCYSMWNFIASCLSNQSLNVGLDVILHQNQKAYLDHFDWTIPKPWTKLSSPNLFESIKKPWRRSCVTSVKRPFFVSPVHSLYPPLLLSRARCGWQSMRMDCVCWTTQWWVSSWADHPLMCCQNKICCQNNLEFRKSILLLNFRLDFIAVKSRDSF